MVTGLINKLPPGFIAFGCVGVVGFAVDASILTALIFKFGWGHYSARFVSFSVAVMVTWLLNRLWTFRQHSTVNKAREYSVYMGIQTVGALLNLAIYSACIYLSSSLTQMPVIPLAIGSGIAMFFNFTASRRYAFTG